jgi:uncharacterized protein (TIGR02145 family)
MKKTFILMTAALALLTMAASCSKDEPNEPEAPTPELSVAPASISATGTAGSYSITVTSNVAWTATAGADWLTLSPAAGEGNCTVAVNVAENASAAERTASITVTAGDLSEKVAVTQPMATPPHAASTQTWAIGHQIWSDAIHIPECNKEDFPHSVTDPSCRSYSASGTVYYYYNWIYVDQYANALCPSPWRVPVSDDFAELDIALGGDGSNRIDEDPEWVNANYINRWGGAYSGYALAEDIGQVGEGGGYWSSELNGSYVYFLFFTSDGGIAPKNYTGKYFGTQVRCVK